MRMRMGLGLNLEIGVGVLTVFLLARNNNWVPICVSLLLLIFQTLWAPLTRLMRDRPTGQGRGLYQFWIFHNF